MKKAKNNALKKGKKDNYPKFIVIEGIDGSGKGTQTALLAEHLQKKGKNVMILDFPRYGNPSASLVELYLNGDFGSASDVTAYQASIFYAIDRYAASREIKDHLKKGGVIVSNRYTTANQIHQAGKIKDGKKQAQFLKWLDSLEHELLQIPRPEVTIFLDVPHKIGQKLVGKKDPRAYLKNGKTHDIHEADSKHLENTRRTALVVAKKFKWKKIDCIDPSGTMRSIADIHNEICTVIGV